MSQSFVHLRVHTDYSMLQAACNVKKLVAKAKEQGFTALALTDYGNLCGGFEFYTQCQAAGIKPILGCYFNLAPGKRQDRGSTASSGLILLAKTYAGYQNLCRLNSLAHLEGYHGKPRIDRESLEKYREDLLAIIPMTQGETGLALKANERPRAEAFIAWAEGLWGKGEVFLEIQDHGAEDEKLLLPGVVKLAEDLDVPVVATNTVLYLEKKHHDAHDILTCIGDKRLVSEASRPKLMTKEYYLKSPQEMSDRFSRWPDAIANSLEIANRCDCELPKKANHYPRYDWCEGLSDKEYLYKKCLEAIPFRFAFDPHMPREQMDKSQLVVIDRLELELRIIDKAGYNSYFLVVWDFIKAARDMGIPVGPGRGSGAGSIVAYLLTITNIDPLKYALFFERFLNPDRVSPPDFDIDFCERRRPEVIEYVRQKYGAARVAQIGTYGTLKAKAVIKDVARTLGVDHTDADRITKLISDNPKTNLGYCLLDLSDSKNREKYDKDETLRAIHDDSSLFRELYHSDPAVAELVDKARPLEGLNRNMSIHAAGVIIGDQPLHHLVPLTISPEGGAVTQFSAGPCEELGLLKMDFLGLRTLTLIDDCLKLIKKTRGKTVDIDTIPLDCPKTYKILNEGRTVAVFQLESEGMQKLCKRFMIDRFENIIAILALYRPGAMDYIDLYIDVKKGIKPAEYEVPEKMQPILDETCGIMIYQEQVMQVAQAVAGFSLGQADLLRRAMGKKKKEEMEKQWASFKDGSVANGYSEEIAKKVFDKIELFAGYGFNKSHSAAYGLITYQTAWLKANYPAEFMAGVMTSEMGNAEKLAFFVAECRDMNLSLLAPCVNESSNAFDVDSQGRVRYGLGAIKGVGAGAAEVILAARAKDGPFKNLSDLCDRCAGNALNKRVLECLVKAGALDAFGKKRSATFAVIEKALQLASSAAADRESGQLSLFDLFSAADKAATIDLKYPELKEWDLKARLEDEKALLGYYATGHPLDTHASLVKKYSTNTFTALKNGDDDRRSARIGCMIKSVSEKRSKKDGRAFGILVLEDLTDAIEAPCFGADWPRCRAAAREGAAVLAEGEFSRDESGAVKFMVRSLLPIEDAVAAWSVDMQLRLSESESDVTQIEKLRAALETSRKRFGSFEKRKLAETFLMPYEKDPDTLSRLERYLADQFSPLSTIAEAQATLADPRFGNVNNRQLIDPNARYNAVGALRDLKSKHKLSFCVKTTLGDFAWIELPADMRTLCTWELVTELRTILGEGAIQIKADTTVQEARRPVWKKRETADRD